MLNRLPNRLLILLTALVAASLACNYPGSGASTTPEPVVISSQEVANLEQNLQAAEATAASGGPISLVITEGQLTSLAALELQEIKEPLIEEIQILLRDEQIQVSAKITQSGISARLKLALTVSIGADGLPKTHAVSASLGPIPVPESLLTQLTDEIDRILAAQLRQNGQAVTVQSISINDGVMAVTGILK